VCRTILALGALDTLAIREGMPRTACLERNESPVLSSSVV
jgi:hypothetical protein